MWVAIQSCCSLYAHDMHYVHYILFIVINFHVGNHANTFFNNFVLNQLWVNNGQLQEKIINCGLNLC